MKKFLSILFILPIFIFSFLFVYKNSNVLAVDDVNLATPSEVNAFELFWPVVAGKVRGDSLYFLKTFKEKVREFFIFDDVKKAEYYSFLSTKRLLEYEKLVLDNKDFDNAEITLKDYEKNIKKGNDKATFEKQKIFLDSLVMKVDESQKTLLLKVLPTLDLQIERTY